MCGIYAVVSSRPGCGSLAPVLERRLRARGPDQMGCLEVEVEGEAGNIAVSFTSTVLSLRGRDGVTGQPLVDESSGSMLCWNGEAWKMAGRSIRGNDGRRVLDELLAAGGSRRDQGDGILINVLRSIEGPFAFVYLDKPAKRLYYGRDRLGRRSLLVKTGDPLCFSSVTDGSPCHWLEVEADGIYSLHLDVGTLKTGFKETKYYWAEDENLVSGLAQFNATVSALPKPLSRDSPSVAALRCHLEESLRERVLEVPHPPGAPSASDARLAILFSGGLDCTVLARMTSEVAPPDQAIDLINVAFENPRIAAAHANSVSRHDLYELCPDRITGRKSFAELLAVCPRKPWRFVTVNVPFSMASAHKPEIIDLMYPHNTEMDLSIAMALYFAARGQGLAEESVGSAARPYVSTARVLLSGLGADELFGGYTRHATAFAKHGYRGLAEELKLDLGRLGKRNLGRDDRVMAHWGKEVRFPFLAEGLVRWAIETPVPEKCDFEHGPCEVDGIEPGKRVLRLLAHELGMASVAGEKKRAIQFGARTAKMASGKVKGTTLVALP